MGINTTITFSESDFAQINLDGNTRYRAIKTADISITQDSVHEDSESFNVDMGTPSDTLVTLGSGSANVSVTITDDDVTVTPPVLTALTINTGTLTPTFSSSHLSYNVPDVGYGTHLMTITATPESSAEVSFLDSFNSVLVDLDDMDRGSAGFSQDWEYHRQGEGCQGRSYSGLHPRHYKNKAHSQH